MFDVTINQKPQVNISRSTSQRMWLVCLCAALAAIQSALSDSGASIIVVLTALLSAILAELLITGKTRGFASIKDGSAAASAMVFSLLLPNQIHPLYAALGALFAMVVVKHSFGGLGSNWLNPSLGGYLFVRFSWPAAFNAALAGSSLQLLRMTGMGETVLVGTAVDSTVSSFLNNTLFSFFGVELPPGYIDLLVLRSPGIIADRGLLALLAGTIIISAFRISRAWIPAVYLGTFGLLVFIFGDLPFHQQLWNGDLLFALFSGGTMMAAFVLCSDPATGAKSWIGILASTACAGLFTWLFRYGGFEVYGAFFAIALVNALTPMFRFFEERLFYSHRWKVQAVLSSGGKQPNVRQALPQGRDR